MQRWGHRCLLLYHQNGCVVAMLSKRACPDRVGELDRSPPVTAHAARRALVVASLSGRVIRVNLYSSCPVLLHLGLGLSMLRRPHAFVIGIRLAFPVVSLGQLGWSWDAARRFDVAARAC